MMDVLSCMREVEHLFARRAPFDEVIAKIDECLALPGGDAYRPSIEHYRVTAYSSYGRPAGECIPVIDAYLALQPSLPARAAAVLAACGERPELAARYLDSMVAEVEGASLAAPDDDELASLLQHAYRVRQRVRGERAKVIAERVLSVDGEPGRLVIVMIYEPEPDREAGEGWLCELRVQGALQQRDRAHGLDALQALIHAIESVRKLLDDSGLSLTWAGGEPGDHGVLRIEPPEAP
jgi:hypothetical protein